MDKKYCHNCGRENDVNNEFCPGCGTKLLNVEDKNPTNNQNVPPPVYGQYAQPPVQPIPPMQPPVIEEPLPEIDFDGVSNKELFAYTGSERIVNKFVSMHKNNSKISWCWPVAVLSLFLGFFGAAIWYMHRKMYKVAVIFIVIGVLIQSAGYVVSGEVKEINQLISMGQSITDGSEYLSDNAENTPQIDLDAITDSLLTSENVNLGAVIFDLVDGLINLTLMILLGLFSMNTYKKHCINRVKEYRKVDIEEKYYYHGLSTVGGTIGATVLLVILGYIVIQTGLVALFAVIFGA